VPDEARTGRGSPRWHTRAPGDVFAVMRAQNPTPRIIQINHPRRGSDSLFDAIDLDTTTLMARREPTELGLPASTNLSDLGFDAMEVCNGGSEDDTEEVFVDWLEMVAAGHPAAATGSSDSHGPSRFAGENRTYVWVGAGADDPTTVDPAAVVEAIRARHVVVGTSMFVTAGIVVGANPPSLPGDTVAIGGAPNVTLRIRVQAASWQPLARIQIFEGTTAIMTIPLDPSDTAPLRYADDVTLPAPAADTFYVVRADGAGPGNPVHDDEPMPSFTNPLFVTVD
jgi:hypothetical protein